MFTFHIYFFVYLEGFRSDLLNPVTGTIIKFPGWIFSEVLIQAAVLCIAQILVLFLLQGYSQNLRKAQN